MNIKIVSGGQTGVDQGALEAAVQLGLEYGGWAPARWHPGRQYEKYCAEGRMLFLSLYPVMDRLPTKQELYQRCHEMGDIVVNGLSCLRDANKATSEN